jgi:ABC-2 type transport system permease protein
MRNWADATKEGPLSETLRRCSAIDGLVRIGQMGASLEEVRADWFYLWLLTAVYFGLALAASRRRAAIEAAHAV